MSKQQSLEQLLKQTQSSMSVHDLIRVWRSHKVRPWSTLPELYLKVGKKLLSSGEVPFALQVLSRGLEAIFPPQNDEVKPGQREPVYLEPELRDPSEVIEEHECLYAPLMQQKALALAQSGAAETAQRILKKLRDANYLDGETEGILGRTFKDQAFRKNPSFCEDQLGLAYLQAAYRSYYNGYYRAGVSLCSGEQRDSLRMLCNAMQYNGINAATCAFWLGEHEIAIALARRILESSEPMRDGAEGGACACFASPWTSVTLGEAHLLLGILGQEHERSANLERSLASYTRYLEQIGANFRDISTTRRQFDRIMACARRHGIAPTNGVGLSSDLFPLPRFLCHVSEPPVHEAPCEERCGHLEQRDNTYQTLRDGFDKLLGALTCFKVVATVSCPAEILFVEAVLVRRDVLSLKGELGLVGLHLILPFERARIEETLDPCWILRLDLILQAATEVEILGQHQDDLSIVELRSFAAIYAQGLARLQADTLDAQGETLVTCGDFGMGCRSVPLAWNAANPVLSTKPRRMENGSNHYVCLPLLFSDIERYSSLDDRALLAFSRIYPGLVWEVIEPEGDNILLRRTQGDSVMLGFKDIPTALRVARALRDRVAKVNWQEKGLPCPLRARIALDAGPCCDYDDFVRNHTEICGAYVNRAARLEVVTPPGEINASQTFAALARLDPGWAFDLALVGRRPRPKGYGEIVAYLVR